MFFRFPRLSNQSTSERLPEAAVRSHHPPAAEKSYKDGGIELWTPILPTAPAAFLYPPLPCVTLTYYHFGVSSSTPPLSPVSLPFFAMTSHPPSSSSALPPSQLSTETLRNLLEPVTIPSSSPEASFINWGLSYTCKPAAVFQPETEEQCALIVELARRDGQPVRAAGVGHSPSDLACTGGYMLRTEKLSKVIEVSRTCQHPYVRKKSEAVSETSCCLHPMFRYLSYFCLTAISGSDYCNEIWRQAPRFLPSNLICSNPP